MSHAYKTARFRCGAAIGALGLAAILTSGATQAEGKVLAKVNGVEITEDDMKLALDDIGPGLPRQLEGKARDFYVLDFLIDEQLVVQKAQADKVAETPEFAKKLAYLRDKALMETLLGKVAKEAATDAAIKQTYDEAAKNQKPDTEYHAHHILVPTEDEAKAALKRVRSGEDFTKVATELSKDPGAKGGDLGRFTKDRMVPEFGDAASKLEPGQVSEPVKTQFGPGHRPPRRKASEDLPAARPGARSGDPLRRAEGAVRRRAEAARDRKDRTHRSGSAGERRQQGRSAEGRRQEEGRREEKVNRTVRLLPSPAAGGKGSHRSKECVSYVLDRFLDFFLGLGGRNPG